MCSKTQAGYVSFLRILDRHCCARVSFSKSKTSTWDRRRWSSHGELKLWKNLYFTANEWDNWLTNGDSNSWTHPVDNVAVITVNADVEQLGHKPSGRNKTWCTCCVHIFGLSEHNNRFLGSNLIVSEMRNVIWFRLPCDCILLWAGLENRRSSRDEDCYRQMVPIRAGQVKEGGLSLLQFKSSLLLHNSSRNFETCSCWETNF